MSFAYPGLPPPPPPSEPVLATAVILHRDGPDGREVFLVRRGDARRFAAGFHAFPGGRLDPADRATPVPGLEGEAAAIVACAVRELFEETGVLAVRGAGLLGPEARDAARHALLDETTTLPALLAAHALAIEPAAFVPAGRWVTPDFSPLRYDARLFLVRLPPGEAAVVWPGELDSGQWLTCAEALRRWERGEILFHPPNLWGVSVLARPGPIDLDLLRGPPLREGPVTHRIETQGGLLQVPMRTPTLPPAAHTNAWLLPFASGDGVAVVDPGAHDPAERTWLWAVLDGLAAEGKPPRAVWLTHVHPDHVGSAAAVAERYRVPVLAHPLAAGRVPGVAAITPLREGELAGGRWRVLETPGHAREHLAFLDEATGALVCGDMASTLSTIVIDPAEGDMAVYEVQLERLAALGPRTLYPAHGPPAPGAAAKLRELREHRREREARVVEALAAPGTLEAITARAYQDVPAAVHPVAARSCLAVLEKLAREGRARVDRGLWSGPAGRR